jgi:hypothetical protein
MHPHLLYHFTQETLVELQIIITRYITQITTAWRLLRLRVEETAPDLGVAENMLNNESLTVNKGWSFRLGVKSGAKNFPL